jgi:hypothetical protein
MVQTAVIYLSLIMAVYLFIFSYIEGIRISNSEEKVSGGTFIFSFPMAVIFSGFTYMLN